MIYGYHITLDFVHTLQDVDLQSRATAIAVDRERPVGLGKGRSPGAHPHQA